MVERVIFEVDKNGHAAAETAEAQRWIAKMGTSLCHRLVAAQDVEGRPHCFATCAARLASGKSKEQPAAQVLIRGNLCELSCTRVGEQVLVSVERLGRRASRKPQLVGARERQILFHMARGATAEELAERLGLSLATIRVHLEHIQRRLSLREEHEPDQEERSAARWNVLQELKEYGFRRR